MTDQVMAGQKVVVSTAELQMMGPDRLRRIVSISIPWADPATVERAVADLLAGRPIS